MAYLGKLIPPKLTTIERDAITSPSEGEVVYNTTTLSLNLFDGSSWVNIDVYGTNLNQFILSTETNTSAPHTTWVSVINDSTSSLVAGDYRFRK